MGKFIDATGHKFGRLTALSHLRIDIRPSGRHYHIYLCQCDCGNTLEVTSEQLRSGNTRSCGCLQREIAGDTFRKHGGSGTRLYSIWKGIKKRCYNKKEHCYKWYGGKGITMCDEWLNNFQFFKKWAFENGYDDNLTIDRVNSEMNYCPENCRWLPLFENIRRMHVKK
jgi:hypothetical protein